MNSKVAETVYNSSARTLSCQNPWQRFNCAVKGFDYLENRNGFDCFFVVFRRGALHLAESQQVPAGLGWCWSNASWPWWWMTDHRCLSFHPFLLFLFWTSLDGDRWWVQGGWRSEWWSKNWKLIGFQRAWHGPVRRATCQRRVPVHFFIFFHIDKWEVQSELYWNGRFPDKHATCWCTRERTGPNAHVLYNPARMLYSCKCAVSTRRRFTARNFTKHSSRQALYMHTWLHQGKTLNWKIYGLIIHCVCREGSKRGALKV